MPRDAIQRLRDVGLRVSPAVNTDTDYFIGRHSWQEDGRCLLHLRDGKWIFRRWDWMPGPGLDDFECEFATPDAAVEAVLAFYFGSPTVIDGWVLPLHLHPELQKDNICFALQRAVMITPEQFGEIEKDRRKGYLEELAKKQEPLKKWWEEVSALAKDELLGKDELTQLQIVTSLVNAGRLPERPEVGPILGYQEYQRALQSQFLLIQHAEDRFKTLRLRRDLGEVYILFVN